MTIQALCEWIVLGIGILFFVIILARPESGKIGEILDEDDRFRMTMAPIILYGILALIIIALIYTLLNH